MEHQEKEKNLKELNKMKLILDKYTKLFKDDGLDDCEELQKIEVLQNQIKLGLDKLQGKEISPVKILEIGDPKTIKPEYKGVNFDYEANAEKIRYYHNNLTDGGHFYGSKHKIEGMVFLYKQPTH
ncbi:MAG: hypothetical protein AB8E82_19095 [Aureispira sp.]